MNARMRTLLFCGLLIGLTSCGDPLQEHVEAIEYIRGRYKQLELGSDFGDLEVVYYDACIPAPYDPEHKETCRNGRAWPYGPFGCTIEIRLRGWSAAHTSIAHEIAHCRMYLWVGDPGHDGEIWEWVPVVNTELREMGL